MSTQTNVKRWLGYLQPDEMSVNSRRVEELRVLDEELKHLEWLATCVWNEAGKTDLWDFDELYAMVGSSDEVAFSPPQADERLSLRSKLDELYSRTFDANDIIDNIIDRIGLPDRFDPSQRRKAVKPAISLVRARAFCFLFAKTRVHGLDLPETHRLGPLNWPERISTSSAQRPRRRRRSHV